MTAKGKWMLILRRKTNQRIEIVHTGSGDVMRIVVTKVEPCQVHIGFDDTARNFDIQREDRVREK